MYGYEIMKCTETDTARAELNALFMKRSIWRCRRRMFSSGAMQCFSLYRFAFIPGVRVYVHHSLMQKIQEKTSWRHEGHYNCFVLP